MKVKRESLLILGIGNYLMGDEGVGVHLVQALEKEKLPDGVDLVDGGTAGLLLMDYLERYDQVIMIDATLDDHAPGTIRLIEPRFATDFPRAMSTHEIGLKDLIDGLSLLEKLPKIYLFTMSVQDIANLHVGLSQSVKDAMPLLKNEVLRKVAELRSDVYQWNNPPLN